MRRSLACLPALLVLMAAWAGSAPADDKKEPKKDAGFEMSKEEKDLLELTNKERAAEKLPPLEANPLLFKAARGHSANMAKQGEMKHELDGKGPGQRIREAGYQAVRAGENIGFTENPKGPAEEMIRLWMDSPIHRSNILNPAYREIGIGLARGEKGEIYYTQVFGRRAAR
jgi:uncharacterized protein YkwD